MAEVAKEDNGAKCQTCTMPCDDEIATSTSSLLQPSTAASAATAAGILSTAIDRKITPFDGNAVELLILMLDDEGPARVDVEERVCACVYA